jgi:hypothetical protein
MENYWVALAAAAALALTGTSFIIWRFRVHAAKRRLAALDAYAERESAQHARKRVQAFLGR